MKRSQINDIMRDATGFIGKMNFMMPPFAFWKLDDWRNKGAEYQEIIDNQLGWDITDFGSHDFRNIGLLMFTLRNGNFDNTRYQKPYAEKIMIVEENQVTPYHFHFKKMEDIINRGGGNLIVRLYNSDAMGGFTDTPVMASVDGRNYEVPAGTEIRVTPGESITLINGVYHSFWGEAGKGRILVGEVSRVNDDRVDNRFHQTIGRFPEIEEDVQPLHLLTEDYASFLKRG